jgi:hypothetical protein
MRTRHMLYPLSYGGDSILADRQPRRLANAKIGCYASLVATKRSFQVDIADLDDVRTKISEVEQIVEEKREAMSQAARELHYWTAVLDRLRLVSGERKQAATKKPEEGEGTILDAVVGEVRRKQGPTNANEIAAQLTIMGFPDVKHKTVGWALWKANHEGQIRRVGRGFYAPLDWQGETLLDQVPAGNGRDRGNKDETKEG